MSIFSSIVLVFEKGIYFINLTRYSLTIKDKAN